jgi:hypothetical protein
VGATMKNAEETHRVRRNELLSVIADLKAYGAATGNDNFKDDADFIRYLSAALDACTDAEVGACRRWLGSLDRKKTPAVSTFAAMLEDLNIKRQ